MRKLSRDKLKKSQASVKDPNTFIDNAETIPPATKKKVSDKKKPVSISLTSKDSKELQDLVKKFNRISYDKSDGDVEINRSDLVNAMKNHFIEMNDNDFFNLINKLIS